MFKSVPQRWLFFYHIDFYKSLRVSACKLVRVDERRCHWKRAWPHCKHHRGQDSMHRFCGGCAAQDTPCPPPPDPSPQVCKRHLDTHTFWFSQFYSSVQLLSSNTYHLSHTRSRTLSTAALQSLQKGCPLTPSTEVPHLQKLTPP